jgi:DNA replication and repair protein RecF
VFEMESRLFNISSSIQAGSKKVFREDNHEYEKFSDHIGKIPVVLVAPDDIGLVKDGSELRRKFFDGILSQIDKAYLEALIQYNYALRNRNSLLKMFAERGTVDMLAVESFDRVLIQTGTIIYRKRVSFVNQFQPFFQKHYQFLTDNEETTRFQYVSGLHEVEFAEGLRNTRQRDLLLQRTSFGIHKDDYSFLLESGEMKRFGSQGQQKSFLISLKLAQYNIFEASKGFKPILLLDDIFDKLDDQRIERLLALIDQDSGQLFITDARPHRTMELIKKFSKAGSVFRVDRGKVLMER